MKIRIEVDIDNAAFDENQLELAEIVARQIPSAAEIKAQAPEDGRIKISSVAHGKLKDSNGNTVGSWRAD